MLPRALAAIGVPSDFLEAPVVAHVAKLRVGRPTAAGVYNEAPVNTADPQK